MAGGDQGAAVGPVSASGGAVGRERVAAVIPVVVAAGWLAVWVLAARVIYTRIRPAREPIYCRDWIGCGRGSHHELCYRKGLTDETDARVFALTGGLLWPLTLLLAVVSGVAFRHVPLTGAEGAARIARLEKELGYRD